MDHTSLSVCHTSIFDIIAILLFHYLSVLFTFKKILPSFCTITFDREGKEFIVILQAFLKFGKVHETHKHNKMHMAHAT